MSIWSPQASRCRRSILRAFLIVALLILTSPTTVAAFPTSTRCAAAGGAVRAEAATRPAASEAVNRFGLRIAEVPIIYVERRAGQSKMSKTVMLESAFTPWRLIIQRRAPRTP